jgi:murein L,D-transpeptidase YcbB/YkuD
MVWDSQILVPVGQSNVQDGSMPAHRPSARHYDISRADRFFGRFMRAGVFFGLVAGLTVLSTVPVSAQSNWWESITGTGPPDYTGRKQEEERARKRAQRVRAKLDDLRPDPTPYRSDEMIAAMEAAIDRYQRLVNTGGWPIVPKGRMMRVGESDDRVPILRKRLQMSGDLPPGGSSYYGSSYTFDERLAAAVHRFQRRHGLRPTGRVERSTYPALNMTAQQRLAQLRLNLGRIHDLMKNGVEDRYILVNVPAFQLEAVERYEVQQRHRTIVGRTERQTPSISATIRGLNFFPYWRVPDSVANFDIIPRLRKEPDYLVKEKIRVLNGVDGPEIDPYTIVWGSPDAARLKFRQDPGPQNALGLVRIDMPNADIVYMHDTPMKTLFDQRSRNFSAGCVRVQDVFKLVEWIARYEPGGWDQPGQVDRVIQVGQPLDVKLTRPIPVYFAYITAWAERDGEVVFRPDIYGRDGAVSRVAEVEVERDPEGRPPPNMLAP